MPLLVALLVLDVCKIMQNSTYTTSFQRYFHCKSLFELKISRSILLQLSWKYLSLFRLVWKKLPPWNLFEYRMHYIKPSLYIYHRISIWRCVIILFHALYARVCVFFAFQCSFCAQNQITLYSCVCVWVLCVYNVVKTFKYGLLFVTFFCCCITSESHSTLHFLSILFALFASSVIHPSF